MSSAGTSAPGVTLEARVVAPSRHTPLAIGVPLLLMVLALSFGGVYLWGELLLELGAAALFAAWVIEELGAEKVTVVPCRLYWPALLFAILIGAQLLLRTTVYRYATAGAALQWAAFGLIGFVAMQYLDDRRQRNRLLHALAAFGGGVALFAIVQRLASNDRIYWFWPTRWPTLFFGPYINHAHYAGLMELLFPCAAVLALRRSSSLEARIFWAAAAVVMVASIALSGSRGGMLAIVVELVVVAIYLAQSEGMRRSLLAVVGLAVLGFALVAWLDNGDLAHRLGSISSLEQEGSGAGRLTIARDAARMALARPLLGWGLGTFADVYPQFRSFSTELLIDHAHNDYLEMLAETGLAGGVLTLWFLVAVFRGSRRGLEHWHYRESGAALTLAALVGCAGLLAHSLTDFNLHIPANAALFFVLCGVAAFRPASLSEMPPGPWSRRLQRDEPLVIDADDVADTAPDASP